MPGSIWHKPACCGLLLLGLVQTVPAEELRPPSWQISADRLTRYREPEHIIAEGQVVLSRPPAAGAEPLEVSADWVRYDVDPGMVWARGQVTLQSTEYLVRAEEARLSLDRQTGTLFESTIVVPQESYSLYLSGQEIEKTGELTYQIEEGTITSCPLQPDRSPPWMIRSRKARIKKNGMAVLNHATLNIKNIPIAYTPYLVFPAKGERDSGFLLPEISNSDRSGAGLIAPYFINISPSHDITLYPGYSEKRGVWAGLEARYVADLRSRGTFQGSYLHDRLEDSPADDYLTDGFLRTDNNRYWLRGKADHQFSETLITRLDYDFVSDRDFLEEFRKGRNGFDATNRQFLMTFNRGLQEETVDIRESSLQAVKSWSNMLLMGEVRGVQDVSDIPVAETSVQTLPRLLFSGRTLLPHTPMSLAWDSEYVHFWRDRGIGFQRLDLHPRLIASLPPGVLEGRVGGGVRETLYLVETHGEASWPDDRFQSRTMEDFEAEIASTLVRDFRPEAGSLATLSHAVRPALIYNYIPAADQEALPFIDSTDRVEPRNWLTYQLANHFEAGEKEMAARYLGYLRLSQTYDLREDRRSPAFLEDKQRPLSDLLLELDFLPFPSLRVNYETALSFYGQGVTYYKVLTGYSDSRGNILAIDYNYQRDPAASPPFFYGKGPSESEQKLTMALLTHLTGALSLQGELTQTWRTENGQDMSEVDETLRLVYHPACWGVEIMASKTPDDKRFAIVFSLTGIGDLFGFGFLEGSGFQYELL